MSRSVVDILRPAVLHEEVDADRRASRASPLERPARTSVISKKIGHTCRTRCNGVAEVPINA